MFRTATTLLASAALATALAACSASGGQDGCTQPPVQQYATPTLVLPSPGSTNVPTNVHIVKISTTINTIVGVLTLNAPSGNIAATSAKLDGSQPNPNAFLWDVTFPVLKAHTNYTLTETITYPGACLGPDIVQSHAVGSFTTQ